jgi:hypothetical protein
MYVIRLSAFATLLAVVGLVLPATVQAQTARLLDRTEAQPRHDLPNQAAVPKEKCLRALNGACSNPVVVEAARLRAIIIPTVRVSYLGTPMGTIGGKYIPFERFFQDNPAIFGLPTNVLVQGCCVTRSK